MGNSLYQASDDPNTIRGNKTAKYSNATTNLSLKNSPDLTKSLLNYKNEGNCGCK